MTLGTFIDLLKRIVRVSLETVNTANCLRANGAIRERFLS
jgi:hypothetical protein